MRRLLIAVLAVLVLACAKTAPVVEPAAPKPSYVEAVRPIQIKTTEITEQQLAILKTYDWFVQEGFTNICTAEHLSDRGMSYWLTAAHCLADAGPEGRFIEGRKVVPVAINEYLDLAVFLVPDLELKASLMLAASDVTTETRLIVAGHPFGYNPIFITRGWVSNVSANFADGPRPFMIFDLAGAPGNSGSPVMNERGEVVSVLQIGWGRDNFSPLTGGSTQENLRNFLHPLSQDTLSNALAVHQLLSIIGK